MIFESANPSFKSHSVEENAAGASLSHSAQTNGSVICQVCRNLGDGEPWREQLTCGAHGCGKCRRVISESEWNANLVKKHKHCKRPLVCNTCAELGYTARNMCGIKCEGFCQRVLGSMKFAEDNKKNTKRRLNSKTICQDSL